MLSINTILAVLAPLLLLPLAAAAPTPNAVAVGTTLTAPGTIEDGFTLPENISPGVWRARVGSNGVSYHVKVADIDAAKLASRAVDAEATSHLLHARYPGTHVSTSCHYGYEHDHYAYDLTVDNLAAQLGGGSNIQPGWHWYSIYGETAAYDCNYSNQNIWATGSEIQGHFRITLANACGAYREGWSEWVGPNSSIGSIRVEWGWNFCGRGHS